MNVLILMKRSLLLLSLCTCFTVFAQESEYVDLTNKGTGAAVEKRVSCNADAKKILRGMCMYVGSQDPDPNPIGRYRFMYQRKLLEASCVDLNKDSEEIIGLKIAKVWAENEKNLVCNNTRFDVQSGSLIKYGAALGFDEFIYDLAKWNVNLNKVDESDGRTVMDYIKIQIERNEGNATGTALKKYYEMFKKAGAKHKNEL